MNAQEAITLCRLAKAACPQQALDEFSPEAWALILEPFNFEDSKTALVDIVRQQPFVSPSEIIERVKQIRGKRIAEFGPIEPPPEVEAGEVDYQTWFREVRAAIADGSILPNRVPRPPDPVMQAKVRALIAGAFRSADAAWDDPAGPPPELEEPADA